VGYCFFSAHVLIVESDPLHRERLQKIYGSAVREKPLGPSEQGSLPFFARQTEALSLLKKSFGVWAQGWARGCV
jgi:hypothetical protein